MSADPQVPLSIDADHMYMGVDADRVENFFDSFLYEASNPMLFNF